MYHPASKEHSNSVTFRTFRRQLFHSSLHHILSSLKTGMHEPQIKQCPDGHFRKFIYRLGPYFADYPEQALLASVVQGWCPRYSAVVKSTSPTDLTEIDVQQALRISITIVVHYLELKNIANCSWKLMMQRWFGGLMDSFAMS